MRIIQQSYFVFSGLQKEFLFFANFTPYYVEKFSHRIYPPVRFPARHFGPVTLIHGDAMDVLAALPCRADLLVTDPPYKLTSGGRSGGSMGGVFAPENYDNSGDLMRSVPWRQMAPAIFGALRGDCDAYVMGNDKNIFDAKEAFCASGFKLHNLLVWDKITPTRNRWYMKELEFTLYLWKGRARTINSPGSKQRQAIARPKERFHNTQKPVALFETYIRNSSQPEDIVLDPFAGSAASLVAAMRSGRRAIGVEIEQRWFDAACLRLAREWERIREGQASPDHA